MTIYIAPQFGVPIPERSGYVDMAVRAEAACKTAELLVEHGYNLSPCDEDEMSAEILLLAYAEDPVKASKALTEPRVPDLSPMTYVLVKSVLDRFGMLVAPRAAEIRNLVNNKLIIETENDDARIRLKALELLGKTTDVALFSDRKIVEVNHTTSAELRIQLREKLVKLTKGDDGTYTLPATPDEADESDEANEADYATEDGENQLLEQYPQ